ncbi:MAG TPA: ATP-binding cassette domain-containing protein [Candidatus Cloacimonadota bacterium]|nr:ATP-binding cassette domain-containing protein [Candidatus Cloacimonadota bacterium]
MSLIRLDNIGIEFAGSYLFRGINCTIEHNSRIGLIGANGSGKTTLLRIMLRELEPTEGTVSGSKHLNIGYLSQVPEFDSEQTVEEYVRSARPDLQTAWQEMLIAGDSDDINALHKAEERLQQAGGYSFETEMKLTLTAMKFPKEVWQRKLTSFSGGERTRLALAKLLLSDYELLLLDEPTNHLDIAMLVWLEKYLVNQSRPYLIVSHDRTFLDQTVSTIFNLEEGTLSITKGNYSSWRKAEEISLLEQERQWKQQQKWLRETKDFIARNLAGQKTNQAKARLKSLKRTTLLQQPHKKQSPQLNIETGSRSGNDVYRLENVSFKIGDKLLAKDVNLYCGYRDRICLLGPNGCGKTTFIKLLLEEIQPWQGFVKVGASLSIGYYDQYQNEMEEDLTVFETLKQVIPQATDGYILSWLARFGFKGDAVQKSVSVLSGGEKSRLYLSLLIHAKPNLLLLDEPTNHLDIPMLDALLEALTEYDGTIIFVSHDRYFIQQLAKRFWVFHNVISGQEIYPTISAEDKPFNDLLELAYQEPEPVKEKSAYINNRQKKVNPWVLEQLQREIEKKHKELNLAQQELQTLQEKLSLRETYTSEEVIRDLHKRMKNLENDIAAAKITVDQLETKYLELSYDNGR